MASLVLPANTYTQMPGRPGVDLDGSGALTSGSQTTAPRIYRRNLRRYIQVRRGCIEPLPPLRRASRALVDEAEVIAGAPLPSLLRRLRVRGRRTRDHHGVSSTPRGLVGVVVIG